jgi:hypothetical protein
LGDAVFDLAVSQVRELEEEAQRVADLRGASEMVLTLD